MTTAVPHQALYRRWRAQTFAEIVGQEAVVTTLRNAVRSDRTAFRRVSTTAVWPTISAKVWARQRRYRAWCGTVAICASGAEGALGAGSVVVVWGAVGLTSLLFAGDG